MTLRTDRAGVSEAMRRAAQAWWKRKDAIQRKGPMCKIGFAFDDGKGGIDVVSLELSWDALDTLSEEQLYMTFFSACYKSGEVPS